MAIYKIPLNGGQEKFKVRFDGVQYYCTLYWNYYEQNWFISFYLAEDNTPLMLSMPLVTGVDLLRQFRYLGLTGKLVVYTNGGSFETPTYENIGTESNLYFVVEES